MAIPSLFQARGGAERRFLRYTPGLRERGTHTRIVTGTPKQKKLSDADLASDWYRWPPGQTIPTEPIFGTPIHRVRLPDQTGWRRTWVFNQALLRYCAGCDYRPDVVQLMAPLPPRTLPWLLRLRARGVALLSPYTLPLRIPSGRGRRLVRRASVRLLYDQFDCVVAASTDLRQAALDAGVHTRIEVIPNGVDIERFRPAADQRERHTLLESLGFSRDASLITTVGSVLPRKGADLLLQAWAALAKRFPRTHVVVVGQLPNSRDPELEGFSRKLKEIALASGEPTRVHFIGVVDEVEKYLRASELFVFPSNREGMPNAVLEAMASGLPVVLTPFIGLSADFGRPGREYWLADRNVAALTGMMERALGDETSRLQLGQCGRRWLEKTMSLTDCLDRYADLYRELASRAQTRM